jgi:hypothetical protein
VDNVFIYQLVHGFSPLGSSPRLPQPRSEQVIDYTSLGLPGSGRLEEGFVTLVQRFGSALNLNVHFHMVFLDGAYQTVGAAAPVFRPVAAPESSDLQNLVEQIAGRIGRALERRGLVERDLENARLAADTEAGPLDDLLGHSITYRIAVGPRAGQKLFTLQTVAPRLQGLEAEPNGAARAGGFSLHAGVDIASHQREELGRSALDRTGV